jgi:hypothetical protein
MPASGPPRHGGSRGAAGPSRWTPAATAAASARRPTSPAPLTSATPPSPASRWDSGRRGQRRGPRPLAGAMARAVRVARGGGRLLRWPFSQRRGVGRWPGASRRRLVAAVAPRGDGADLARGDQAAVLGAIGADLVSGARRAGRPRPALGRRRARDGPARSAGGGRRPARGRARPAPRLARRVARRGRPLPRCPSRRARVRPRSPHGGAPRGRTRKSRRTGRPPR